jgi:hypothetical protein
LYGAVVSAASLNRFCSLRMLMLGAGGVVEFLR